MFDPNPYRNACTRLTLGREKLEEMITMTENSTAKKGLSRPLKTVLIAAACVAALTVTAMAAPVAARLFTTFTITYRDASTQTAFTMPTLALEERGGRHILSVDGEETDVTDAFAKDGQYTPVVDGATVTVKADGWVEVNAGQGDKAITYTYNLLEPETDLPADDQLGTYEITTDPSGAILIDGVPMADMELGNYTVTSDGSDAIEITG